MMLSWSVLAFVILVAALAWFWQDSLAARERANAAAIEACERLGLQFLDGTVAFARIALVRNSSGWLALRRTYVFDYTATSIERLQGFVVLLAHRVESVGYAPAAAQGRESLPAAARPASSLDRQHVIPTERVIPAEPGAIDGTAPSSQLTPQPGPQPSNAPSNVYDLDQWRHNRRSSKPPAREAGEDLGDGRQ